MAYSHYYRGNTGANGNSHHAVTRAFSAHGAASGGNWFPDQQSQPADVYHANQAFSSFNSDESVIWCGFFQGFRLGATNKFIITSTDGTVKYFEFDQATVSDFVELDVPFLLPDGFRIDITATPMDLVILYVMYPKRGET